ncbi:pirin family protein [Marinobacter sp.]|uniref:pirin family protein n=1 Tax=Marinobacter sp. TaxID=50741 RepID=UPI0035645A23
MSTDSEALARIGAAWGSIRPGDINLMVAGRGIAHSERERPEVTAKDHRLHRLQL